jgi:hypothetical protein
MGLFLHPGELTGKRNHGDNVHQDPGWIRENEVTLSELLTSERCNWLQTALRDQALVLCVNIVDLEVQQQSVYGIPVCCRKA